MPTTTARVASSLDVFLVQLDFYGKDDAGVDNIYRWSTVAQANPTAYGGYREGRVIQAGQIVLGLSDRQGNWTVGTASFLLADLPDPNTDVALLREFLNNAFQLGIESVDVAISVVTNQDRRNSVAATVCFLGRVTKPRGVEDFKFSLECVDWFGPRIKETISPIPITRADFPNAPDWVLNKYAALIGGTISDESLDSSDRRGLLEAIPVGKVKALDDTDWWLFIVACHPGGGGDGGIINAYVHTQGGVHVLITFDGVAWTYPGHASWAALFGAQLYWVGPSGRRYMAFAGSDAESGLTAVNGSIAPLPIIGYTANAIGAESAGDGTGTTYASLYDILFTWLGVNFYLPDTPHDLTEDWFSAVPEWADGSPRLDTAAVTQAKSDHVDAMPAGHTGEVYINRPMATRELLAHATKSLGCELSAPAGQLTPTVGNPTSPSATLEERHILGKVNFENDNDGMFNIQQVNFAPRYMRSPLPMDQLNPENTVTQLTTSIVLPSTLSQQVYKRQSPAEPVDLLFRSDPLQAADVVSRMLQLSMISPRLITFSCGLHHYLLDEVRPGKTIAINHRELPGGTATVHVRRVTLNLDNLTMSCEALDLATTGIGLAQPFDAGDFFVTGGSEVFNVIAGNVLEFAYKVIGTRMMIRLRTQGMDCGTDPGDITGSLRVRIPGGYTANETISKTQTGFGFDTINSRDQQISVQVDVTNGNDYMVLTINPPTITSWSVYQAGTVGVSLNFSLEVTP